jgi:ABC-type uncharacterized transport system permease subunit
MRRFLNARACIVIALLIGAVIMLAQGYNPLASYAALFEFSLGSPYALATTFKNAVPLVLTGPVGGHCLCVGARSISASRGSC